MFAVSPVPDGEGALAVGGSCLAVLHEDAEGVGAVNRPLDAGCPRRTYRESLNDHGIWTRRLMSKPSPSALGISFNVRWLSNQPGAGARRQQRGEGHRGSEKLHAAPSREPRFQRSVILNKAHLTRLFLRQPEQFATEDAVVQPFDEGDDRVSGINTGVSAPNRDSALRVGGAVLDDPAWSRELAPMNSATQIAASSSLPGSIGSGRSALSTRASVG